MDDLVAGMLGQDGRASKPDHIVALDEAAVLVEEEAAVEIAVPGDAEIGAVIAHRPGGGLAVFGQQRVGDAVGEGAVRLMVDLDELEGQVRGQQSRVGPAQPLPALTTIFRGLQGGRLDIAEQMFDIGGPVIAGSSSRRLRGGCGESSRCGQDAISRRPVSPLMGRDPSRTSFRPL